jgi:cytochrome c556
MMALRINMKRVWIGLISAIALAGGFSIGMIASAQAPSDSSPPVASVKQLMLDLIHPSSNDILLAIYRGGPKDEKEWAAVRRSAVTLAESGNMLMVRGRARDQGDWMKDAKLLVDVGNSAYRAAQAKDGTALAGLAEAVDAACTTCHKQYRPNVFPKDGGSK